MNVAVVSYDYKLSWEACKVLAQEDMSSNVCRKEQQRGQILMTDGTIYQAIGDDSIKMEGQRFSQLIIVDDNRWHVLSKRKEIISYLINRNNFIDADWQVQKYER